MSAFPAVLDTCVLYPAYLADTMLSIASAGTFRPLWSAHILDELERNLLEAGLPSSAVTHRLEQMRRSFPDASVAGYESLIDSMSCDPKDRHVLAAAVRARAEVLVTFNVKDFPSDSLKPYDVAVVVPDSFLLDQLDLYPGVVLSAINRQVARYHRPALTAADLLTRLAVAGARDFAGEASRYFD